MSTFSTATLGVITATASSQRDAVRDQVKMVKMTCTRRHLGKIALAALPGGKLLAKPNSRYYGVQIGIILSPTALRDIPIGADEILKNLVELGIGGIEMQEVRVEKYAGAPPAPQGTGRTPLTAEQQEARRKAEAEIKAWRLSASMDKYKALRRKYADAGVEMYAFRLARLTKDTSDDELAYFFNTAQALGANQITVELPIDAGLTQRLGAYAAKRKVMIGYHNHTQVNFNSWDTALSQSKYNGINFDVGHFAAAVSQSPIPFIQKHHDRITCLHLKDRKFGGPTAAKTCLGVRGIPSQRDPGNDAEGEIQVPGRH